MAGATAHIAYFRQQFVVRQQWLSEQEYGQLVALSQILPGSGSSQVGFTVGYHRGGVTGALAAFIDFTTLSSILMYVLAVYRQSQSTILAGLTTGLKLLAVVVADAMYGNFCHSVLHRSLAAITAVVILVFGGLPIQLAAIVIAALLGADLLPKYALLGAALAMLGIFTPVFVSTEVSAQALIVVVVAYAILVKYRPPIVVLVVVFAALGIGMEFMA